MTKNHESLAGIVHDHFSTGEAMIGIKKLTYSEQVAEYIKQCILEGKLSPGDQIKEVQLSNTLGVSRAPIREALQTLAREGLISSEPQKGKYVSALTSKQILDSYFTGAVLEGAAVSEALDRYTEEDFAKLKQILDEMKNVVSKSKNVENLATLDSTFHNVLFSKIDNQLLIDLCRRSCQGISKFLLYQHWIKLYTPEGMYRRHYEIYEALREGDPIKLEHVIREHYIDSGKRMSKYGVDVS